MGDELGRFRDDGYVILERRARRAGARRAHAPRSRRSSATARWAATTSRASDRPARLQPRRQGRRRSCAWPSTRASSSCSTRCCCPTSCLSTLQSIRLHPGETAQPWHTDDAFYLVPRPRPRARRLGDLGDRGLHRRQRRDRGDPRQPPLGDGASRTTRAHEVVPRDHARRLGDRLRRGALAPRRRQPHRRARASRSAPQYCQPWLRPQESQL